MRWCYEKIGNEKWILKKELDELKNRFNNYERCLSKDKNQEAFNTEGIISVPLLEKCLSQK